MSSFEYQGVDVAGQAVSGVISASSDADAKRLLAESGIFPGAVWPKTRRRWSPLGGKRLSIRQRATLTRSLASLLEARLPVVEALRVIASEKAEGALGEVCEEVGGKVKAGKSLAEALKESPEGFPPLMVSLVAAGERSGSLGETLQAYAAYLENQDQIRGKIRAMMAYPLLVLSLAAGLVIVLFVFVLPALQGIFESYRGSLPLPTRILLGIERTVTESPWVLLLAAAGVASGAWLVAGVAPLRKGWARLVLSLPLFGKTLKALETARFAFSLSTLLKGGVPLEEALFLTQGTLRNPLFGEAIRRARAGILEGDSLVRHLGQGDLFPAMAIQLVGVGERTGNLPKMLDHLAKVFREEGERRYEVLLRLVEPGLILVIGAVIALIALAVLLPILEAGRLVQG